MGKMAMYLLGNESLVCVCVEWIDKQNTKHIVASSQVVQVASVKTEKRGKGKRVAKGSSKYNPVPRMASIVVALVIGVVC